MCLLSTCGLCGEPIESTPEINLGGTGKEECYDLAWEAVEVVEKEHRQCAASLAARGHLPFDKEDVLFGDGD